MASAYTLTVNVIAKRRIQQGDQGRFRAVFSKRFSKNINRVTSLLILIKTTATGCGTGGNTAAAHCAQLGDLFSV